MLASWERLDSLAWSSISSTVNQRNSNGEDPATQLGGGNSNIFGIFTPDPWGDSLQFDGCIFFQRGWFNHHLARHPCVQIAAIENVFPRGDLFPDLETLKFPWWKSSPFLGWYLFQLLTGFLLGGEGSMFPMSLSSSPCLVGWVVAKPPKRKPIQKFMGVTSTREWPDQEGDIENLWKIHGKQTVIDSSIWQKKGKRWRSYMVPWLTFFCVSLFVALQNRCKLCFHFPIDLAVVKLLIIHFNFVVWSRFMQVNGWYDSDMCFPKKT